MVNERALIKKARFPRSVIPLSIIFSNLFHFILALIILIIPLGYTRLLSVEKILILFPSIFLLVTFTTGFSLLTTALNVRYRDVNFFVQALLIVWFYATPIIYSLSLIPQNILWIWRLNPLTTIVQSLQYALIGSPIPEQELVLSNLVTIFLITSVGIIVFTSQSKFFDDFV